jgi:PAS domain S-box-containing protein
MARPEPFDRQIEAVRGRLAMACQGTAMPDGPLSVLAEALEALQVAGEELRQQNEEVRASREAVERERERYQDLFDFAPDCYLETDPGGIITEANRAAAAMFGVAQRYLVAKPLVAYVPQQQHILLLSLLRALRDTCSDGVERAELVIEPRGGASVYVDIIAAAVRDFEGHLVGLRWLLRDVTERKRVEEELRKKDLAIASSINAIAMADLDGNVSYVNGSFLTMWGYDSAAEVLARPALDFWQDADQARSVVRALLKKGSWRGELVAVRRDRSTFEAEDSASLVTDSTGAPVAMMGSFVDITKRRQAERKLQRLYEREKALHEHLEVEMKKRVEFTRALMHELKTPLTPVVMSSETLASQLRDPTLLRIARNIVRGASNLNARIDELHDLARGELGMLSIKPGKVDVRELLLQVVGEVAAVPARRRQTLASCIPPSLPVVRCDRTRVRQIVTNLLNNAFKFTSEGGRIALGAECADHSLVVQVQDTGAGIDERLQERLFDPYFRVDGNTERLSGLGLGLALCKTLVELHGGHIWVTSSPGKGSTFGFSLPIDGPG